jgi:hypothetical protein
VSSVALHILAAYAKEAERLRQRHEPGDRQWCTSLLARPNLADPYLHVLLDKRASEPAGC